MPDETNQEQHSGVTRLAFSCKECGLVKARLTVRARNPDETIGEWVQSLKPTLALHHRIRSPRCANQKLDLHLEGTLYPGGTLQEIMDTIGLPRQEV